MTKQKPKIKEIDIGDGGEREVIVSTDQVTSSNPAGGESNKPNIKLPSPQPLLMNLEPEQQQVRQTFSSQFHH